MNLSQRINLLAKLGNYLIENNDEWKRVKLKAYQENAWFTPEFIDIACKNIAEQFLQKDLLTDWAKQYSVPDTAENPRTVGVVMAGNIPLAGFHDFLCVFISGNKQQIKLSSKDNVLLPFLINRLVEWNADAAGIAAFSDMLKNCDAYIATGSNNSGRYFEYYFGKYPSVIRRNRASAVILNGNETREELDLLCDDMMLYFGLGCRNVTKIFVPEEYDFLPLINALKKYNYFFDLNKYRHNFDYQLALLQMNSKFYMNSGAVLLSESQSLFSPVSVVNYEFYEDEKKLEYLINDENIQCLVGENFIPLGATQQPSLTDYADGVDTMDFLNKLRLP